MSRRAAFAACIVLVGCSGSGVGSIPGSRTTTEDTSATEPAAGATAGLATDAGSTDPSSPADRGSAPTMDGGNDSGAPVSLDASMPPPPPSADAGVAACTMTVAASNICGHRGGGTLPGTDLVEPMAAPRPILLGLPLCGHLEQGGRDTFTVSVNKDDCLEIDLRSNNAQLRVIGGGAIISANGNSVSELHAGAAGFVVIIVTAHASEDYALMIR